jgi:hypothetical protein
MKISFLLGADPEVFVGKAGRFYPASNLIPGTKEVPHKVFNGAVQVDGLALEFNVDPAESYEEFQSNIDIVYEILKSMVPGYDMLEVSAVELSEGDKVLADPQSLIRGCSPDLNVYTEENNPVIPDDCDIHAVGGHLHVGNIFSEGMSERDKYNMSLRLVKLLDKHVGAYSVLWDKDTLRRKVYGKAGSCRLKSYGVEYRTLSNAWIFNKQLTKFVYDGVAKAVEELVNGAEVVTETYRNLIDSGNQSHPYFFNNPNAQRVKAIMSLS